jgi:DMSO/TMAO reductase YedYZ molybdopterin-dependent catalytic subunit
MDASFCRRKLISRLALTALPGLFTKRGLPQTPSSTDTQDSKASQAPLSSLITLNSDAFVRNHFPSPKLELSGWRLSVSGGVRQPFELDYRALLELPRQVRAVTTECAGNGVGGNQVSTSTWTGTPLRDLLDQAGLDPGVRFIRLIGNDQGLVETSQEQPVPFARSIPLAKALAPETMLAYRMNEAVLPEEHGFPLRALVPGWYGMDSVKWLVGIEALKSEDLSYFMTEKYVATRLLAVGAELNPLSRMPVKSQISYPRDGDRLPPSNIELEGLAWAGENKIESVEVAIPGVGGWTAAKLADKPQPFQWVRWKCAWKANRPGMHSITCRATDSAGRAQAISPDPLRLDAYENAWLHTVRVEILK